MFNAGCVQRGMTDRCDNVTYILINNGPRSVFCPSLAGLLTKTSREEKHQDDKPRNCSSQTCPEHLPGESLSGLGPWGRLLP